LRKHNWPVFDEASCQADSAIDHDLIQFALTFRIFETTQTRQMAPAEQVVELHCLRTSEPSQAFVTNLSAGLATVLLVLPAAALAQSERSLGNRDKLADDPTKVITKIGVSYDNNYDLDDGNLSFSGSFAFDEARKINAHLNSDASEWRVGGSWLFSFGILNFNFGKNEYVNDATQTNYSVGTFVPLSRFGFAPAGFQIFPTAGYTYNDGEYPVCVEATCALDDATADFTPENGYQMVTASGGSGYVGVFALKALPRNWALKGVLTTSYGSKNPEGENFKGVVMGIGASYAPNKTHSFSVFAYMIDNNTYLDEADKRFNLAYTYQFD
jgi:hypothetical protein